MRFVLWSLRTLIGDTEGRRQHLASRAYEGEARVRGEGMI